MDTNKDKKVDAQEMRMAYFIEIDVNRDGTITGNELCKHGMKYHKEDACSGAMVRETASFLLQSPASIRSS